MRKLVLFIFILCLSVPALAAQPKAKKNAVVKQPQTTQPVSPEQNARDIERIEKYMNGMKSLQAEFTQVSDNGELRHGKMEILRPGRMRIVYDAPSKDFIIADGNFINIWDGDLQQQTSLPIDANLGDIMLRENIKLSGDITVDNIDRAPARIEITLFATKDQGAGKLTLVFEDNPLKLRQWRVFDAQGRTTSVSLENAREGVELSSSIFHFTPPNLGKSSKSKDK